MEKEPEIESSVAPAMSIENAITLVFSVKLEHTTEQCVHNALGISSTID